MCGLVSVLSTLGVPVVAGSEDNITSFSAWVAGPEGNPRSSWVDFDFEDDATSREPFYREGEQPEPSHRFMSPDDNEEEEDEEADEDESDEEEEAAAATSSEE